MATRCTDSLRRRPTLRGPVSLHSVSRFDGALHHRGHRGRGGIFPDALDLTYSVSSASAVVESSVPVRKMKLAQLLATAASLVIVNALLGAHGRDARYVEEVRWTKDHVARTLAASRSELGLAGTKRKVEMKTVGARTCAVAGVLAFDVDDGYAFDVDEPVDVTITYAPDLSTAPFALGWDRNSGDGYGVSTDIKPDPGAPLRRITLRLDRARFAGQGLLKTDLAIGARNQGAIAVCDIEIARTGTTRAPAAFGRIHLEVKDAQSGRAAAARVGLYDVTGRTPLPSDDAVPVHRFADEARLQWMNRRTFWPSANRQAFYVTGSYDARVPAGIYDLILARGPEYRLVHRKVDVRANETTTVDAALERYADLPASGWYSGDSHIHLMRDAPMDLAIWAQLAAEDVHVGNLLEMGNIDGTYFKQPAWDRAGQFERDGYALVPGQEDPRTGMRGHTIHWNLKSHVHFEKEAFFHYDRVFERTRSQGALTGYAHLGELFNGRRGLALDVPFGLVDFIEVLQGGRLNTDIWYSFLNLGYKVLPVGGADYPYFGPTLPGVERTYVRLDAPFSAAAWFDAFRRGHAYVTNGPFVRLTVNGREMGEELRVARGTPLEVAADAQLNPDVDDLDRLELVVLGDVDAREAANGTDRVHLQKAIVADHSMWIAARAYGSHQQPQFTTVGHTAPVYVVVDGEPTWKRSEVAALVDYQRAQLNELLTVPIDPNSDLEAWETGDMLVDQWPQQLPLLRPRIQEADRRYRQLLDRLRTSSSQQ